ncbi:HNH/ENDO VII family nuclease [Fusobacterium nucleatum]|nr:HNH/ENDO VII family nuclease [Fusobacterium nucleatum]
MNKKINESTVQDARENTLNKKNEVKLDDVLGKLEPNENLVPNSEILSQVKENYNKEVNENTEIKRELTNEEKQKIKDEIDWSDGIVDYIKSMKEYEIYKNAGLQEMEVNAKKCLLRSDIDLEQKDEKGRTNKERMEKGEPPLDKNKESIELHHIGQKSNSPFAELTKTEHIRNGNDTILHDKNKESEIDRVKRYQKEKRGHWKARSEM